MHAKLMSPRRKWQVSSLKIEQVCTHRLQLPQSRRRRDLYQFISIANQLAKLCEPAYTIMCMLYIDSPGCTSNQLHSTTCCLPRNSTCYYRYYYRKDAQPGAASAHTPLL